MTVARYISLGILVVGLALMTMMIIVESEPGALPLAMVLIGGVGYGVARWRGRSNTP